MNLDCAFCKHDIEADSSYCDQCGKQLLMCPQCGQLCATKFCNKHGKPVVPYVAGGAGSAAGGAGAAPLSVTTTPVGNAAGSSSTVTATSPIAVPNQVSQAAGVPAGNPIATPGAAKVSGALRLFNTSQSLSVTPADGDVLGRRGGQHVATFSHFGQISGNHLQLRQDDQKKWWAKDLNSSNGSFLNKARLKPGAEFLLQDGATLTLGDIPLTVEIQ